MKVGNNMNKNYTYNDYASVFNWLADPTEVQLTTYLNDLGRAQTLAFALGDDETVQFYEQAIEVLEEKLEEVALRNVTKLIPERYHH